MSHKCPSEFQPGDWLPRNIVQRWLANCGDGVRIYRGSRIYPADRVRIGDYSQIDEGVFIFAGLGVTIGKHVHLALGSSISGGGECVIHDFAGIGAGVRLITGTENTDGSGLTNPTIPPEYRAVRRGLIEIGPHAVIFTNSVVLPNVKVGPGAVVAAGSVVHHDLKPWGIYAGQPLVRIGIRPKETLFAKAEELLKRTVEKR